VSKRIAFISTYEHPTRASVEKMLRKAFPDHDMDVIHVKDVIRQHREWVIPNLTCMVREYWRQLLVRRIHWRAAYFRTTFILKHLRTAMSSVLSPRDYAFSFQIQSLFDTSVPGIPHFIYTDHTHLSNLKSRYFDRRDLRPKAWVDLEREIYHRAARVFKRSTDVMQDLAHFYGLPPEHAECVYAGSNVSLPEGFQQNNAGYSNKNILFVGSDWERKGGPVLISAFELARRIHSDATLTIIGASPEVSVQGCTVVGPLPLQEISDHYARASVFCVPTQLEPFGIVFLEAMMHRLPVVSTRIGALPDMIVDNVNGALVEPNDVSGLSAVLIRLLDSPSLCRDLGDNGFRRAEELYNWDGVGRRLRHSILSLTASGGAA